MLLVDEFIRGTLAKIVQLGYLILWLELVVSLQVATPVGADHLYMPVKHHRKVFLHESSVLAVAASHLSVDWTKNLVFHCLNDSGPLSFLDSKLAQGIMSDEILHVCLLAIEEALKLLVSMFAYALCQVDYEI